MDWCDADAGTKTGTSYVPGVVGNCDKKVGSGGHVMLAKWCRSAGGSFPYSSGHSEDSLITCEVDYVTTVKWKQSRRLARVHLQEPPSTNAIGTTTLMLVRWRMDVVGVMVFALVPTQTETPAIIIAANDNLAVHVWGGFDEGNHLRLHNDEEHAKSTALSQRSIVEIGDGTVIICLQFVGSEIKLQLKRKDAAQNPDSQYSILERKKWQKDDLRYQYQIVRSQRRWHRRRPLPQAT